MIMSTEKIREELELLKSRLELNAREDAKLVEKCIPSCRRYYVGRQDAWEMASEDIGSLLERLR